MQHLYPEERGMQGIAAGHRLKNKETCAWIEKMSFSFVFFLVLSYLCQRQKDLNNTNEDTVQHTL
jgi:hypothetical protein